MVVYAQELQAQKQAIIQTDSAAPGHCLSRCAIHTTGDLLQITGNTPMQTCRHKCGCFNSNKKYTCSSFSAFLLYCILGCICVCLCVWWVQAEWREEVKQHFEKIKSEGTCLHRLDEELINRRREELRSVLWQQQSSNII